MRRIPKRYVRPAVVLACVAALALAVLVALPDAASARPTPRVAHPDATARPLVDHYYTLLKDGDRAGLQRFLSTGFQIQRADGSGAGKAVYLTKLPTIGNFTISKLTASMSNGSLVVRYYSEVEGVANGKAYTPGPAPRLSIFTWNGNRWQLAAHANFNPLTG